MNPAVSGMQQNPAMQMMAQQQAQIAANMLSGSPPLGQVVPGHPSVQIIPPVQ